MAERTADEVAQIFSAAGDSVTLINSVAAQSTITDEDKNTLKRNVDHLEFIKDYKHQDGKRIRKKMVPLAFGLVKTLLLKMRRLLLVNLSIKDYNLSSYLIHCGN